MPKRPQVSLRGPTYDKLKAEADSRGVTAVELLDQILLKGLKKPKSGK